eukprot:CAMPEP_0119517964 /NCGR_PEP_ID=MMETSP1344-20130328/34717_1 /TAXON_ID=236787 /ORGANISM="Florenciella parvula, Strain CCMP2471" /LENGTH=96 /DNA_ID=CAMNT_0007555609 /DNA_START=18 /DNA_END=308 /DNA_ORIENTATION=+
MATPAKSLRTILRYLKKLPSGSQDPTYHAEVMRQFRTPSPPEMAERHTQQAADYARLITAVHEQKLLRADWAGEKMTQEERIRKTGELVGFKLPGE